MFQSNRSKKVTPGVMNYFPMAVEVEEWWRRKREQRERIPVFDFRDKYEMS